MAIAACDREEAPRCRDDRDCDDGRVCVAPSGLCVGMTTPLDIDASLAPDAPPGDASVADAGD